MAAGDVGADRGVCGAGGEVSVQRVRCSEYLSAHAADMRCVQARGRVPAGRWVADCTRAMLGAHEAP
jgi:hypothetical protein